MKITPDVFEAFLKCVTKCWLRATGEPSSGNTYAEWVKGQNETYRLPETDRLLAQTPPAESAVSPPSSISKQPSGGSGWTSPWRCLIRFVAADVRRLKLKMQSAGCKMRN